MNPEQLIIASPPGAALYAKTNEQTVILIKEDEKHLSSLSSSTIVTIRSRLLIYENIPLVVTLFMVGLDTEMIYELCWNYHEASGDKYFQDIAKQDKLILFFYVGKERKHSIQIDNSLKDSFRQYIEEVKKFPAWSLEEFDKAKEKLNEDYPSADDLWEVLGK